MARLLVEVCEPDGPCRPFDGRPQLGSCHPTYHHRLTQRRRQLWICRAPAVEVSAHADDDQRQSQFSTSLALTPDGRRLVSASVAGHLTMWDAATGKLIAATRHGSAGSPSCRTAPWSPGMKRAESSAGSRTSRRPLTVSAAPSAAR